ncbi:MAG: hypothetical protein ACI9JL_002480 [Paracoccaceae bacterium]|jgi:hypothetical protein
MARGRYLSLEEARKSGKLKQFAKEHPSDGNERVFDALFGRMTKTTSEDEQTSSEDDDAC